MPIQQLRLLRQKKFAQHTHGERAACRAERELRCLLDRVRSIFGRAFFRSAS